MDYIAFYFPQFYAIAENDRWWGRGFTDWDLVKKARPLATGHHQPRMPKVGFYDQSRPEVVHQQIELAQTYGLSGFNFYHYWFDGKLLLEKPLEHFARDHNHNLTYCITWANETWTRQWVGSPEVLIAQRYLADPVLWQAHFDYLRPFFEDERYMRLDGKPVFCIYRPEQHPHLASWLDFFVDQAEKAGLGGISPVAIKSFPVADEASLYQHFAAVINFQPRLYFSYLRGQRSPLWQRAEPYLRRLPETLQLWLAGLRARRQGGSVYDYQALWQFILQSAQTAGAQEFQSVAVDWDNTARYGSRSHRFSGVDVDTFSAGLSRLSRIEAAKGVPYIFINAWNEWSEAAYLEPDTERDTAYLQVIKQLVTEYGA